MDLMKSTDKPAFAEDVRAWQGRVLAGRKQEKNFLKEGRRITKIYEEGKEQEGQEADTCTPFNVLYSNTETLAPALYNNLPRPVVQRRFKDDDPVGKEASEVVKRMLEYLLDSNDQDYSDFDSMMRSAVLEGLLPGRGVTRFKYDAKVEYDAEGKPASVSYETVCGEEVAWNRIVFGYAKRWCDLPWIAFEHFFTKAELKENFPDLSAAELEAIPRAVTGGTEDGASENEPDDPNRMDKQGTGEQFAHVYEIWDKASRKIKFTAIGHGKWLKQEDDPLQLSGFFPIPRIMMFLPKISSLMPTPLYRMYQEQAEELNVVTTRITRIVKAMKVRGFYDSNIGDIAELLKKEDNTLLPATNVAAMLQGQTLDKSIWLMPLNDLVGVLQQLLAHRQQVKQVIYEITGISDILRGSSQASETATAQNIKNQWGTLRLKKQQKEVQRYVRDCLRLMAEIACTKLSPKTIAAMTGLNYPSAAEKSQTQAAMQQMQAQGQQPPPEVAAKLQEAMSKPTWEDILGVLQNDLTRNYRIDIETNSTVDSDATEDKQDVAEVMNAIAQFMNGVQPMLEAGYMSFDVAKSMLLATIRRFRFGTEVEDQIKAMAAPPPKGADPAEEAKAKAEQEKAQMDLQAKKMDLEARQAQAQAEAAASQQQAQLRAAEMQQEAQLKEREFGMRMQEMDRQAQLAEREFEMRLTELELKQQALREATALKMDAAAQAAAFKQEATPAAPTKGES